MKKQPGHFVISLDFELAWGIHDSIGIPRYQDNILGAREVIPLLLDRFSRDGIRVTWAVVGMLFFDKKKDLLQALPQKPRYQNETISSYNYLECVGEDELTDPCHFAKSIILAIKETPGQEIASHTFSHFYCVEKGQMADDFLHDIAAIDKVARHEGVTLQSLVFPRNQFNETYRDILIQNGYLGIRGNEKSWIYRPNEQGESLWKRLLRLADTYFNVSGNNCYLPEDVFERGLCNVRSSRFLRPYSRRLKILEPLKLTRIKSQMNHAAQNGKIFHLWWHPHNFGVETDRNLQNLSQLLEHYKMLKRAYGFTSSNMQDIERLCG